MDQGQCWDEYLPQIGNRWMIQVLKKFRGRRKTEKRLGDPTAGPGDEIFKSATSGEIQTSMCNPKADAGDGKLKSASSEDIQTSLSNEVTTLKHEAIKISRESEEAGKFDSGTHKSSSVDHEADLENVLPATFEGRTPADTANATANEAKEGLDADTEEDKLTAEPEYHSHELEQEDSDNEGTKEASLDMSRCVQMFADNTVVRNYCWLLNFYTTNSPATNHYIVRILHRICEECALEPMLYQLSILQIFYKILSNNAMHESEDHKFVFAFLTRLVRHLFKKLRTQPLLFVELLFWKTKKECHNISADYMIHSLKGQLRNSHGVKSRISIRDALGDDEEEPPPIIAGEAPPSSPERKIRKRFNKDGQALVVKPRINIRDALGDDDDDDNMPLSSVAGAKLQASPPSQERKRSKGLRKNKRATVDEEENPLAMMTEAIDGLPPSRARKRLNNRGRDGRATGIKLRTNFLAGFSEDEQQPLLGVTGEGLQSSWGTHARKRPNNKGADGTAINTRDALGDQAMAEVGRLQASWGTHARKKLSNRTKGTDQATGNDENASGDAQIDKREVLYRTHQAAGQSGDSDDTGVRVADFYGSNQTTEAAVAHLPVNVHDKAGSEKVEVVQETLPKRRRLAKKATRYSQDEDPRHLANGLQLSDEVSPHFDKLEDY